MKRKIFSISAVFFITLVFNVSFAQKDTLKNTLYISDIENYMKYIDTTGLDTGSFNGTTYTRSRKPKPIGGFGFDIFTNINKDSVVKIEYHSTIYVDNVYTNTYKTCYYKNNLLVAAKLKLEVVATLKLASNDASFPYIRKEFFRDNKLISSVVLKNILKKRKYIRKTRAILLDDGLDFFKEYGKSF